MSISQQQEQQYKDVGRRGGQVDTSGKSAADRQAIDKAVNDGKAQGNR